MWNFPTNIFENLKTNLVEHHSILLWTHKFNQGEVFLMLRRYLSSIEA